VIKKSNIIYFFLINLFALCIFSIFYLKWIHIKNDVGRELYQAFAIATQGKTLYTDLTHYFGPLAPYSNALFLKLVGETIFDFSLIGLILLSISAILIYFIGKTILSQTNSFWASIIFISLSAINNGGGSFFMPYSYSHTYGIVLTFVNLLILLYLKKEYSLSFQFLYNVSLSLLLFTKQEYILVYLGFQIAYFFVCLQDFKKQLLKIGFIQFITSSILILFWHHILFIDYSVWELLSSSKHMFQQHNSSVFKNFLMLYSPSTFILAIITLFPYFFIIAISQLVKQFQSKWLIIIAISVFCIFLNLNSITEEWLNRSFLWNWLTLLFTVYSCYLILFRKHVIDNVFIILFISFVLYNRQQSSSWMWQGLNLLILIYIIQKITDFFRNPLIKQIIIGLLLLFGIYAIPFKLNQRWDSLNVTSITGESIPVNKDWAKPIQNAIDFIDSTPITSTVYTGQETAWLNLLTHRYNNIRNQQWWGYMKDEIIEDILITKPEYIVVSTYPIENKFRLFGGGNLIYESILLSYNEIQTFQNEHIKIEILHLND